MAAARADAVALGSEARHGLADPGDASGDQAGLIAAGLLEAEDPATHQGPTRLVVVIARGLKDGDIQGRAGFLEASRHGDSGGTAAHDQYLVMAHGP